MKRYQFLHCTVLQRNGNFSMLEMCVDHVDGGSSSQYHFEVEGMPIETELLSLGPSFSAPGNIWKRFPLFSYSSTAIAVRTAKKKMLKAGRLRC